MPFLNEIVPGLVSTAVETTETRVKTFSTRIFFVGVFSLGGFGFLLAGLYQILLTHTGLYAPWIVGSLMSLAGLLSYRFIR